MNHLGKVTRVRKLAFVAQRRGNSIPIFGRPPCRMTVRPSCKKTLVELGTIGGSTSHVGSDRVMLAGQPNMSALLCRRLLAIRGTVRWSA
ncbi:hypothetical protein GW17_00023393 [Ensete ventricosum]|nr:hypothetical protein GW17_00023393 [Ensete ventricosum]